MKHQHAGPKMLYEPADKIRSDVIRAKDEAVDANKIIRGRGVVDEESARPREVSIMSLSGAQ